MAAIISVWYVGTIDMMAINKPGARDKTHFSRRMTTKQKPLVSFFSEKDANHFHFFVFQQPKYKSLNSEGVRETTSR